ncbi:MAG: M15 family metallopeptidase [Clostridia bacterium]|nr:M15 family metallopeptidase [Clostridia bacterium]
MNKPIPNVQDPKLYEKLEISNSKFVEIKNNEKFEVVMQYPLLKMDNAEERCFVREEVYQKLLIASNLLPKGYKFKILDAWRPFELQRELFYKYSEKIITEFKLQDKTKEEQNEFIKKFVSLPNKNVLVPPVHTTGGAIDLTIIDENGNELEMGTYFDEFTDRTNTNYFEDSDLKIKDNRRLLYNIMTSVGFVNLPSEWWHYDYYDRFWGYYNNEPSRYEGIFEVKDVLKNLK